MLGRFSSSDSDLGFPMRNDVVSGTQVQAFGCVNQDEHSVPVTSRGRVLKVRSVNVQHNEDRDEGWVGHKTTSRYNTYNGDDEIVPIPRQQQRSNVARRNTRGGHYDRTEHGIRARACHGSGGDEENEEKCNGGSDARNLTRSKRFTIEGQRGRRCHDDAEEGGKSPRPESAGSDATSSMASSGTSSSGSQHPESDVSSIASSASSYARNHLMQQHAAASRMEHGGGGLGEQKQMIPSAMTTTRGFSVENPMVDRAMAGGRSKKQLPPGMVRCYVQRQSKGLRATKYYMYIQDTEDGDRLILAAQRQRKNGNMHIFDMSQGYIGSKLSKKHGNYIGKVCGKMGSSSHMVYGTARGSVDAATVIFEKDGIVDKIKEGVMPRRMCVLLPKDTHGSTGASQQPPKAQTDILLRTFRAMGRSPVSNRAVRVLGNKAPVYERGNYRLNFYGRVTHASVKNFQLIEKRGAEDDDEQDILLQFGKVGSDRFNLDYSEARFSPMLAFGIALTHFNF